MAWNRGKPKTTGSTTVKIAGGRQANEGGHDVNVEQGTDEPAEAHAHGVGYDRGEGVANSRRHRVGHLDGEALIEEESVLPMTYIVICF